MRKTWIIMAIPVVVLAAGWALAATVKNGRYSYYSDLDGPACQDNGGEGLLRCPGLGKWGASGWYVDINDGGNIITASIVQYDSKAEGLTLTGRGLGQKAEWRGSGAGRYFKADSVIMRMRPVEDDHRISSVLIVSRLKPRGACVIAVVDAKASKDANVLAQRAADNQAMKCRDTAS
jgi:hypothetical protein